MPDLAQFQDTFAEALHADEPVGRLDREAGFAVYRNTVARGAIEALRAGYPTIHALIGEDAFNAAAFDFQAGRPPASPVLAGYGAGFAGYLASQPWTSELPYLADVARLDRLWIEALLAADPASIRTEGPLPARARSFAGFRLALYPATRFAWLDTPAMTIWSAHRSPGGFDELEPEWRPEGALFTRRPSAALAAVEPWPISRAEYRLLVATGSGASVNAIAAALDAAHPEADLASLIARLIGRSAIHPV